MLSRSFLFIAQFRIPFLSVFRDKGHIAQEEMLALSAKLNCHVREQAAQSTNAIPQTRRKLEGVNRQINNIINAISDGNYQQAMKDRLDALETEKIKI